MGNVLILVEPQELNNYGKSLTGSTTLWSRIDTIRKDSNATPFGDVYIISWSMTMEVTASLRPCKDKCCSREWQLQDGLHSPYVTLGEKAD